MKKVFPVLFVSTTTLIAVVGVCGTFNGSFRQLHAEDHEYTVEFTQSDIKSSSISGSYEKTGTFAFSKQTQSGFEFGTTATVKGSDISFNNTNKMVYVDAEKDDWTDSGNGAIEMEFLFHNVSSAVSVVFNGYIDRSTSKTYTNATTISDGYKIAINESLEENFYITSIVVKYTCSY